MQKIRVLLADDEVEFATTLATRLELRNYATAVAHTGPATLDAIEEQDPDILILDLKMPELDGLEVLARARRSHPQLAVIILTGQGSFDAGREGMELGAFDYISKPVDLGLLIDKIEQAYKDKTGE